MNLSLIEDLKSLYSAVVADVLDVNGYPNQFLTPAVKALTPATRVAGRVFTVKAEVVDAVPERPYELEMEAIDTAERGDVLVVDANHDQSCAFWGELLSTACIAKGVGGVVMTGCTRDLWALNQLDFPVFGIGASPADSKGRLDVTEIRESILIDGVIAKHGDYILGDVDGVVIIPQAIAAKVIAAAKEKVAGENTCRDELAAGTPVAEVFRKHGIL
ncbi:MAG: RraA family protein [Verrucomicrobiaceae bacterium]|nr:RraA family protein [Verrucomicrobiaceae bacterium]